MADLNSNAARVLAEFGGRLPAHLLQFEDARREFLQTRALELQKLGASDTDKTVQKISLRLKDRVGAVLVPKGLEGVIPAFVETSVCNCGNCGSVEKVEIVPVEKIPEYTSGRVIAFFGNPLQYRTNFNCCSAALWFDPVEDLMSIEGADETKFVPAFTTYLVKKAALNLCGALLMNIALHSAPEEDERMKIIIGAITGFQNNLSIQVSEWALEFKKYVNFPFNTQPNLRRTQDEISVRGYHNTTRSRPLDYIG